MTTKEEVEKLVATHRAMRLASGSAREFVLRAGDTPLLRRVLLYAMDPLRSFGVKDYEAPKPIDRGSLQYSILEDSVEAFFNVLDACSSRQLSGNAARERVSLALSCIMTDSPDAARILGLVVARDLDFGANAKTVNKVFPGLVPEFMCALAETYSEKHAKWPMLGEVKYDGKRILAVWNGGEVTLYARSGRVETKYQHIRDQALEWFKRHGKHGVLDGELMWGMFGSRKGAEAEALFVVYDYLPYETWSKQRRSDSQLRRTADVLAWLGLRSSKWPHIRRTEGTELHSYEDALQFYNDVVAKGGEGIMLKDPMAPYAFKRGHQWMKLKPVLDEDLEVVEVFEGDGKYSGQLGGVVVERLHKGAKVQVRVGSGFTDEQRAAWYCNSRGGRVQPGEVLFTELVGKTVEVRYTEVTPDGSLRFPRFIKVRDDK